MLFTKFVFEDGLFRKLSINPEHVRIMTVYIVDMFLLSLLIKCWCVEK